MGREPLSHTGKKEEDDFRPTPPEKMRRAEAEQAVVVVAVVVSPPHFKLFPFKSDMRRLWQAGRQTDR